MIINGKKIAEEIIMGLAAKRGSLPPVLRLGVLMGTEDAASASFVKIKERVADRLQVVVVRELLPENATTEDALSALGRLEHVCRGIILQLPLPLGINIEQLLAALPVSLDVDVLMPAPHPVGIRPPVAEAISEIFVRHTISGSGKKAVVVGQGRLVGLPAAELLRDIGAHVAAVTHTQGSLNELKDADIVVLGAGEPGLVQPHMLKEGVVLIDAGTSEQGGKVAGDADPTCAEVASIFTPVPGGVGPIAVAMIFKNLFALAEGHPLRSNR